jgi:hypothetical protein
MIDPGRKEARLGEPDSMAPRAAGDVKSRGRRRTGWQHSPVFAGEDKKRIRLCLGMFAAQETLIPLLRSVHIGEARGPVRA